MVTDLSTETDTSSVRKNRKSMKTRRANMGKKMPKKRQAWDALSAAIAKDPEAFADALRRWRGQFAVTDEQRADELKRLIEARKRWRSYLRSLSQTSSEKQKARPK